VMMRALAAAASASSFVPDFRRLFPQQSSRTRHHISTAPVHRHHSPLSHLPQCIAPPQPPLHPQIYTSDSAGNNAKCIKCITNNAIQHCNTYFAHLNIFDSTLNGLPHGRGAMHVTPPPPPPHHPSPSPPPSPPRSAPLTPHSPEHSSTAACTMAHCHSQMSPPPSPHPFPIFLPLTLPPPPSFRAANTPGNSATTPCMAAAHSTTRGCRERGTTANGSTAAATATVC